MLRQDRPAPAASAPARTLRAVLHAMLRTVREAVLDAWAVVQPIDCLGCGAPDRACCAACRAELASAAVGRARIAADPGVPVLAAAEYGGAARGAVLALKSDARLDAARPLGRLIEAAVRAALAEVPAALARPGIELAPVPTTRAALRRRGYDPVRELLRAAGLPASRVLDAARGPAQKTLRRGERLAAPSSRFAPRGSLDGRSFVLVDDVVTTGATLAACADAIRMAGGEVLAAVAVCATALGSAPSRTPLSGRAPPAS